MSKRKDSWPHSAHAQYWVRHTGWGVYSYDSADDGPECEIIKAVLTNYAQVELWLERLVYTLRGMQS